ncbi:beta-lactamase-like protein [Xylariaceae sp. AK1471]|nr:beta-lactamase-like protein [Xylariaceae sp. AK1471]
MATPPELHIPPSTSTVNVSVINTGTTLRGMKTSSFVEPPILGHDYLAAPCFSFLIQHPTQNRSLIFDLAIKKDWQNWPPPLYKNIVGNGGTPDVPKHVREFLDEHGFDTKNIEAVVWSHSHLDHVGDVSTFEPSTKLIVGPGTKENVFPGYPTKPAAPFNESDVAGHEVEELDFSSSSLKIGGLTAIDYFADGSFYFLDSPGHCVGHICGFARVTSNPDSFILMGGDAVHHGGELRPHPWHPLPASIFPHPFKVMSPTPCPGEIFHQLLPDGREAPFYKPSTKPNSVHFDVPTMIKTIKKLQEADAHNNILIVAAHDSAMLNVADFFPKTANDFMEKGWVQKSRWAWLAEFAKAVGQDENIPREFFGDARPINTDKS